MFDAPCDPESPAHLQAWMLGQFRVEAGATSLTDLRPRCQALLAFLLLHRRLSESRRYLAFLLWPDSTEAQALTNLRHVLHDLQAELPAGCAPIVVTHHTLLLAPRVLYFDVAEFEALTRVGATPDDLSRAVALYQGDLFPDCYDAWIESDRARLRCIRFGAVERLALSWERDGNLTAALELAHRLLNDDPLREATYRLVMRLHASNQDRGAALETYEACRRILHRELDVPPCPATSALYRKILLRA